MKTRDVRLLARIEGMVEKAAASPHENYRRERERRRLVRMARKRKLKV